MEREPRTGGVNFERIGGPIEGLSDREINFRDFLGRLPPLIDWRLSCLQARYCSLNDENEMLRGALIEPMSVQMAGHEEAIIIEKGLSAAGTIEVEKVVFQSRVMVESLGSEELFPVFQIMVDVAGEKFDLKASCPDQILRASRERFDRILKVVEKWPIKPYFCATPVVKFVYNADFYDAVNNSDGKGF